jgi:hypothetical protein
LFAGVLVPADVRTTVDLLLSEEVLYSVIEGNKELPFAAASSF